MANIIPAASAEFETLADTGNWVAWFGCTVEQTVEDANAGTGALKITCNGGSWGVNLNNWPGWSAGVVAEHQYGLEWSTKGGPITGSSATMTFIWRTSGGTMLLEEELVIATSQLNWRSASVLSITPATTARLFCELTGNNPAGTVFYLDSVVADDAPDGGGSAQTITPSSIASAEAFGTPTVAPGPVTITPSSIASSEAFGTPALTTGAVAITPTGIASEEAFGTPTFTVAPGAATITPSSIVSAEAFGTPALTTGPVTITPSSIASAEAFGTPRITGGQLAFTPPERTYSVPADPRVIIVPDTSRTTTVPAESRTLIVPAGDLTTTTSE